MGRSFNRFMSIGDVTHFVQKSVGGKIFRAVEFAHDNTVYRLFSISSRQELGRAAVQHPEFGHRRGVRLRGSESRPCDYPHALVGKKLGSQEGTLLARICSIGALGWQLVIFAKQPELRLLGLVFTTSGAFCGMSVFWTLPQTLLSEKMRPAGIAVISSVGLMGSATSPTVIGFLRDLSGNFAAGLLYSTVLLVISMVLVLGVSRRQAAAASAKVPATALRNSGGV